MGSDDGMAIAGTEVDGIYLAEAIGDKAETGDQAVGIFVGRGIGGNAVYRDGGFMVFHGEGQLLPGCNIGAETGEIVGLAIEEVVAELGEGLAGAAFEHRLEI